MDRITAIIPTWNRSDLVLSILTNLRAQTRAPDQVIVVDNGSTDDSRKVAAGLGAEVIGFAENRGFAAAVNEGIQRATSDWLLILNNDVLLEPEWLARLLTSIAAHGADFGAGKLLRQANERIIDGSWDLVSRGAYAWRCGYGRPDGAAWSRAREVPFVPMTAAVFHRRVFERIGMLETRFESYYEDVDFGIRCVLAGLRGVYEPGAVAVHMEKSTFGKRAYRVMFLSARNQLLLLAKHYPPETLRRFAWPILVGQTLSIFAAAKHGHFITALRGKWDALRKWKEFRGNSRPAKEVEAVFHKTENEIRELQKRIGFDSYWRMYFRLVR